MGCYFYITISLCVLNFNVKAVTTKKDHSLLIRDTDISIATIIAVLYCVCFYIQYTKCADVQALSHKCAILCIIVYIKAYIQFPCFVIKAIMHVFQSINEQNKMKAQLLFSSY